MLKLICCEIYKYKRNKILPALTALSLLFPAALTVMTRSELDGAATIPALHACFDSLYNDSMVYSALLLLPGLFGCVSAILFFNERDCDTFKNLRTIPVTQNELIAAKLIVMYLWAGLYAVCSTVSVSLFCFVLEPAAVYDVPFKILCHVLAGFTMATVSLPVVVLVIYSNQSFLLSLLLSFLYSAVNWLLLIVFSTNEPFLRWLPLINGFLLPSRLLGWRKAVLGLDTLAALPLQEYLRTALYLLAFLVICVLLILRFYKKWSR